MHNYKELKVWQIAMDVVENTYVIYNSLPDSEKYNFGSQITRSSLSIPSNIAEGAGRSTKNDFKRFLDIAVGSSYELETQLLLIENIFKINTETLIEQVKQVQKMIYSLKQSIDRPVLNT